MWTKIFFYTHIKDCIVDNVDNKGLYYSYSLYKLGQEKNNVQGVCKQCR